MVSTSWKLPVTLTTTPVRIGDTMPAIAPIALMTPLTEPIILPDFCHDGPDVAGCVGFGGNRHHQEEKGYGDVISETGDTRYIGIICCLTTNFLYRSVRIGQPSND